MWDGEDPPPEPSEHAGLTEEDLAIDETLSDLDRVISYSSSNIELQRYVHVRMLAETASSAGFETAYEKLFPLLKCISKDKEYLVRQQLVLEIGELCRLCSEANSAKAYSAMLNELLTLIDQLLHDNVVDVRNSAVNTLASVARYVKEDDIMEHVLSIILRMAHDQESDEIRITAAALLNNLAKIIGMELCHQFVIPEVISLSEDPVFRVRKAVSLNLESVFEVAGPTVVEERLLPAFIRLSNDHIWGVRKACAESLPGISQQLELYLRINHLVKIEEALVNDSSKWVRNAVLQKLGYFIATLPAENVSETMLNRYLSLADQDPEEEKNARTFETSTGEENNRIIDNISVHGQISQNHPIEFYCAFSFPAVVITLGSSQWNRLKPLFLVFAQHEKPSVRRIMSHSLHEIARVIGQDHTEYDLMPAFKLFLDDVADVKAGVVKHLAKILALLSSICRETYLSTLEEIRSSSGSITWRFRAFLAEQMCQFTSLFDIKSTQAVIVPLFFKLVDDEVQDVGRKAATCVFDILQRLEKANKVVFEEVVEKIVSKSTAPGYDVRQQFVILCQSFLDSAFSNREMTMHERSMFETKLLPSLLRLSHDTVSNVRLVLANAISRPHMSIFDGISAAIDKLKSDENLDVALAAGAQLNLGQKGNGKK